jgi:hypothetical protein
VRRSVLFGVMLGVVICTVSGCRASGEVAKEDGRLNPRLARARLMWRTSHRSLVRSLGGDVLQVQESHAAVIEQIVRMKHLTDSVASQHWDRVASKYQDLYERARGGVSPRILKLRYHALEREVDRVFRVAWD